MRIPTCASTQAACLHRVWLGPDLSIAEVEAWLDLGGGRASPRAMSRSFLDHGGGTASPPPMPSSTSKWNCHELHPASGPPAHRHRRHLRADEHRRRRLRRHPRRQRHPLQRHPLAGRALLRRVPAPVGDLWLGFRYVPPNADAASITQASANFLEFFDADNQRMAQVRPIRPPTAITPWPMATQRAGRSSYTAPTARRNGSTCAWPSAPRSPSSSTSTACCTAPPPRRTRAAGQAGALRLRQCRAARPHLLEPHLVLCPYRRARRGLDHRPALRAPQPQCHRQLQPDGRQHRGAEGRRHRHAGGQRRTGPAAVLLAHRPHRPGRGLDHRRRAPASRSRRPAPPGRRPPPGSCAWAGSNHDAAPVHRARSGPKPVSSWAVNPADASPWSDLTLPTEVGIVSA
jgi:hypothetical protein